MYELLTVHPFEQGVKALMKTSRFIALAAIVLAIAVAAPAFAQTAPAAKPAPTAQAASTTNMDILAAKIKADKKLLVAQTVGVTDAEGKAFWPVYDACQTDLQGVNEKIKAVIGTYAQEYNANTMTDAKAEALTKGYIAAEEALLASKKSCLAKLNGVIPATKIARYMQVENKIRALINYELAAGIPFVQ
jgi:hypothetical protein